MSAAGQLTVCGASFALRKATISAWMNDPYWVREFAPDHPLTPKWSLELFFEQGVIGEDQYEPHVYYHSLPLTLRSWLQLAGFACEWNEPMDESGKPKGGFYLCQHSNVIEGRLGFHGVGGTRFRVEWSGVCEMLIDDSAQSASLFSLTAETEFTGVTLAASDSESESDVQKRFALCFEASDFLRGEDVWQGSYDSGMGVRQIFFKPRL